MIGMSLTLPPSWDTFCTAISNSTPKGVLNYEDIVGSLLSEEIRRKSLDSSHKGAALSTERGRKQSRGKSQERGKSRSKSRPKKDIECYHCGKKGHYKKDCFAWKKEQKKKKSKKEEKKNNDKKDDKGTSDKLLRWKSAVQDAKRGGSEINSKYPGDLSHKEASVHEAKQDENQHQHEIRWRSDAHAANNAPGVQSAWAASGGHDTSNNSTAASEKSDKRKRKTDSSEEETSLKPYECRFCPMKFSKSQALGGHMNRHRQEREREQLIHARHLVMQQGFSHLMMPAPNCFSSLPKYHQAQLERPTDSSLNYHSKLAAPLATAFTGTQYTNHVSSALPTNVSWSCGNTLGSTVTTTYMNQNSVSLDYLGPLVQGHKSGGTSSLSSVSTYKMQPPNGIPYSGEQDMLSEPFGKNLQSNGCPLNSSPMQLCVYEIPKTALQSQREIAKSQDAGSLVELEGQINILNTSFGSIESSLKFGAYDLAPLQDTLELQSEGSQQYNLAAANGFHLLTYDSKSLYSCPSEGMRITTSNALPDFNAVSGGQLEGLSWALGNPKNVTATNLFSSEEFNLTLAVLNDTGSTAQLKMASPIFGSQGSESALSSLNNTSNLTGRTREAIVLETSAPSIGVDCGLGVIDMEAKSSPASNGGR